MDLISLSKKAFRKPLSQSNFFVLFTTLFIALLVGLSLLAGLDLTFGGNKNPNSCDARLSRQISGNVTETKDAVYQINYSGNSKCLLSAIFNWKNSGAAASVWVYAPDGGIEVIEPSLNQNTSQFSKNSPVPHGRFRFVVKAKNDSVVDYSGKISLK